MYGDIGTFTRNVFSVNDCMGREANIIYRRIVETLEEKMNKPSGFKYKIDK